MALSEIDMTKVKYFDLNNEINIPKDGQIQLNLDQEALDDFIKENVEPNTKKFSSVMERLNWLIERLPRRRLHSPVYARLFGPALPILKGTRLPLPLLYGRLQILRPIRHADQRQVILPRKLHRPGGHERLVPG